MQHTEDPVRKLFLSFVIEFKWVYLDPIKLILKYYQSPATTSYVSIVWFQWVATRIFHERTVKNVKGAAHKIHDFDGSCKETQNVACNGGSSDWPLYTSEWIPSENRQW